MQQCLAVAVLAVSIVVATPAVAQSPKLEMRTPLAAKEHAKAQLIHFGWGKKQWTCLNTLWTKESNWRSAARNKQAVTQIRNGKRVKLHAGGIPQILGLDPATSVPKQIRLGLTYIDSRYQSPCRAWAFWQRNNYY